MLQKYVPFIKVYLSGIQEELKSSESGFYLSRIQLNWLGFCMMGILMTNELNWKAYERMSFGSYSNYAISWMFCKGKILWTLLFITSVRLILKRYGINRGHLEIDDTDRGRSKNAKCFHKLHKLKDKKTGGYLNGQSIVFLVFVTEIITIVVDYEFYAPDPKYQAWKKEDERLKKQKVKKKNRPSAPAPDSRYPKKTEIALMLLSNFRKHFPSLQILSISADALYGIAAFMDGAGQIFFGDKVQVISQIKGVQKVWVDNQWVGVSDYFDNQTKIKIRTKRAVIHPRGQEQGQLVYYASACLKVKSHGKKRLIIALKYEGEEDFRYIVAKDMSWQPIDVIHAYTLRWFVEVFIQDFKEHTGWGRLTKHTGEDGSRRALTLSLLFDHALFLHPSMTALIKDKLVATTVSSLCQRSRIEGLILNIEYLLDKPNPKEELQKIVDNLDKIVPLKPSKKHLVGKNFDRFSKKIA